MVCSVKNETSKRIREYRVGGMEDHYLKEGGHSRLTLEQRSKKIPGASHVSAWGKSTPDKRNTNWKAQRSKHAQLILGTRQEGPRD